MFYCASLLATSARSEQLIAGRYPSIDSFWNTAGVLVSRYWDQVSRRVPNVSSACRDSQERTRQYKGEAREDYKYKYIATGDLAS